MIRRYGPCCFGEGGPSSRSRLAIAALFLRARGGKHFAIGLVFDRGKRMDDYRIDSQGFSIGRWYFPPFCLRRGQCVTLCLPKEARVAQVRINACLTGLEEVPGLNLNGAIVLAEPAASPSGWRRWFYNPSPFDWMKENTTLSDEAIRSFLVEHGLDRQIPLSWFAGTPRMVLGLAASYARKPDVVVFSTAGLDPNGVRTVQQIVSQHLPECSAIYLAWPAIFQEQEHYGIFPNSLFLSVIDKAELPAATMPGGADDRRL